MKMEMMMRARVGLAVVVAIIIAQCVMGRVEAADKRPVTPDDLFKLEEIGDVAISPDGASIVYVRRRPLERARMHQQPFLQGNDRADLWLAPASGGAPVNLTNGDADASGYWMPVWSPDGSKIALLSTRGDGNNVRLWVWDKASGRLTRLSDRGVFLQGAPAFAWVDNQHVAAVLLPAGEKPLSMTVEQRAATVAMREWPKTWAGKETTANVLDSGMPLDLSKRPQSQVALIDVKSATSQPLASAFSLRELRVAPAGAAASNPAGGAGGGAASGPGAGSVGGHIAFLAETTIAQPAPGALLQHGSVNRFLSTDRYRLVVTDAAGKPVPSANSAAGPIGAVVPNTLQWAPDGRAFALIGAEREGGALRLFRGTAGGAIDAVTLADDVDPKALVWIDGERLLLSAEHDATVDGATKKRVDWWLLGPSRAPRNVSASVKAAPGDLWPIGDGQSFVGVAGGDLWQLDLVSGAWKNLTEAFEPKIASIAWPTATPGSARAIVRGPLVLSVLQGASTDYYRLDAGAAPVRLARPSDLATLSAFHPATNVALFAANEPTGTTLTMVQGETRRALVETNAFVGELLQGDVRAIDYRGSEGDALKGWIVLPAKYEAGKRYPMVTWVYAGSLAKDTPSILARLNFDHALNLQLLAAHGYAVLLPSMPLAAEGKDGSDPYMDLAKGVLPAVDKAIELGIADPDRLAVMGQSYGGYSTYGLVTQTNRFKAAIALAGLSDLVSLYGVFDARYRYTDYPHENVFQQSIAETGQVRMGNPPWKDAGRYLRNSPLFYVDRVQTPLLIVQGDMDYVSMTQGEQFFTSLYRQGKRARFVRYWGEGHVFSSPANIRDLWKQMYAWLDEFLMKPASAGAAPTPSADSAPRP
jgi:dipeptidyl aminopeptidase/acylaminoacyl peptidase